MATQSISHTYKTSGSQASGPASITITYTYEITEELNDVIVTVKTLSTGPMSGSGLPTIAALSMIRSSTLDVNGAVLVDKIGSLEENQTIPINKSVKLKKGTVERTCPITITYRPSAAEPSEVARKTFQIGEYYPYVNIYNDNGVKTTAKVIIYDNQGNARRFVPYYYDETGERKRIEASI